MSRKSIFSAVVVSSALLFAVGCAKVPQQSIDAAKNAIETARQGGAEMYSPEQLKSAQGSYDLAMAEIAEQEKQMPFSRSYTRAEELLQSASSSAIAAINGVVPGKQQVRTEVQAITNETTTLIDSIAAQLDTAKKKKKNTDTLTLMLDSAKTMTAEIAGILESDPAGAKTKALQAKDKLIAIKVAADSLHAPAAK